MSQGEELERARIAIPGGWTSTALSLSLRLRGNEPVVEELGKWWKDRTGLPCRSA